MEAILSFRGLEWGTLISGASCLILVSRESTMCGTVIFRGTKALFLWGIIYGTSISGGTMAPFSGAECVALLLFRGHSVWPYNIQGHSGGIIGWHSLGHHFS